jgi:hypothetical protein
MNWSKSGNSNMHSIEMTNPMMSINHKYMVYPAGEMTDSYADMSNYAGIPQYMMSMSTNINSKPQKMTKRQQQNNVVVKKNIATRGNFRKTKRSRKPQGPGEYPMPRFQDSQTFSRIARGGMADSVSKPGGLFSPDEPEPYEYRAIDSQIGPLVRRDHTVDRSQMRNQNNLASLVVSSGKVDSAISPNPRRPMLADSLLFKSTISPQTKGGNSFNQQSITGALGNRPGVASPGKDSRNIKLDPIDMCK